MNPDPKRNSDPVPAAKSDGTSFIFVGDGRSPVPEIFVAFGIEFPKGKAVKVEDKAIAKKLAGNSHFKAA